MLLSDRDPRFRNLPYKVFAFILTGFSFAALTMVFVAWKQGYFEAKTPIIFISATGNDLKVGMAVKISGFKIGEVNDLKLDDLGRVRIGTRIENRYLKWIRRDSVGSVGRDGPIGDSYIDVSIGNKSQPEVTENRELQFVPARSFDSIVGEVRDRVVPVVDQAKLMLQRFNDPKGDLNQTMTNFNHLSASLGGTIQRLDLALDNLDRIESGDIPATLQSARASLAKVDEALAQVQARLPSILAHTDATVGNLDGTIRVARKTIEDAAPDLVGAVHESRQMIRRGRDTVDGVTNSWPLNHIVPPASPQPDRGDSQD